MQPFKSQDEAIELTKEQLKALAPELQATSRLIESSRGRTSTDNAVLAKMAENLGSYACVVDDLWRNLEPFINKPKT